MEAAVMFNSNNIITPLVAGFQPVCVIKACVNQKYVTFLCIHFFGQILFEGVTQFSYKSNNLDHIE
jgi:hypothetical protein